MSDLNEEIGGKETMYGHRGTAGPDSTLTEICFKSEGFHLPGGYKDGI